MLGELDEPFLDFLPSPPPLQVLPVVDCSPPSTPPGGIPSFVHDDVLVNADGTVSQVVPNRAFLSRVAALS